MPVSGRFALGNASFWRVCCRPGKCRGCIEAELMTSPPAAADRGRGAVAGHPEGGVRGAAAAAGGGAASRHGGAAARPPAHLRLWRGARRGPPVGGTNTSGLGHPQGTRRREAVQPHRSAFIWYRSSSCHLTIVLHLKLMHKGCVSLLLHDENGFSEAARLCCLAHTPRSVYMLERGYYCMQG